MSQQSQLFPVTMPTLWHDASGLDVEDTLLDWLLDPSSLTARLKKYCQSFRVEVLGQRIEHCHPLEANDDIIVGEQVLVREVLLYCDDKPQVFARSLLPLRSLTGTEKQLAHLGNESLGQVLFNNPELARKCIEVSSFNHNSSLPKLTQSLGLSQEPLLWGRRSVFILHEKPLMVAEVFLPGAFAYQGAGISP